MSSARERGWTKCRLAGGCIILGITITCLNLGCPSDEPQEPHTPTITLSAEDVSCTDVWLKISFTDNAIPRGCLIKRGEETVFSAGNLPSDTIVVADSLLPARPYVFKAYRTVNSSVTDSSEAATVTTMDTTSHDFTWQIDTLGDGSLSSLYDVAIINDTLAYAVGELYKRDSLGNWDPEAYNLARWNGARWELKRVPFIGACSAVDYPPTRAVWAISDTNLLLASGGSIVRYNGTTATLDCGMNPLLTGAINKIWAQSPQDIYVVGEKGTIVHYNGAGWEQMESGTDVNLLDVWGSPDGNTVWACGFNRSDAATILLRNTGQGWELAYDGTEAGPRIRPDSLSGAYTSVYTRNSSRIFVGASAGIYDAPSTTHGEGKRLSFTQTFFPGFPFRLRGNGANDLTIVGDYGHISHFNGVTWRYFDNFWSSITGFRSVDQRGSLVIAVGFLYDPIDARGVVFRGKR